MATHNVVEHKKWSSTNNPTTKKFNTLSEAWEGITNLIIALFLTVRCLGNYQSPVDNFFLVPKDLASLPLKNDNSLI